MLYEVKYPASHARVTQMVYSGSRNKEVQKQETGSIPGNPKMAMEPAVTVQNPYYPISPY